MMRISLWKMGLIPVCIGSLFASNASGFRLTGTNWSHQASPMGENWNVCPTGMPVSGVQRVKDGAAVWNYTGFQFTFGDDLCLSDGAYPSFNDVNQFDFGGGLPQGVLAEMTTWFFLARPSQAVECDGRMSDAWNWYTGTGNPAANQLDFWSVVAHEEGHCLGLGHEDRIVPRPVMGPTFGAGEVRRNLTADDIAGRNAIYGGGVTGVTCPATQALQSAPNSETSLATLRQFRDRFLARSPEGKLWTRLYYQHAWEATLILLRDSELRIQVRDVIDQMMPAIEAATDGGPLSLTRKDKRAIDKLLKAFAKQASPELRKSIRAARRELRRGKFLSQLNDR